MITNPKLKLYLLITQNNGKRLSDILLVDNLRIPNFKISFDNIYAFQFAEIRLIICETESKASLLYYAKGNFYYRTTSCQWVSFDIDSVLNDEIEDIV